MHIFYSPDISADCNYLDESESRHCINVLRLSKNETIQIIDGKGGFYFAEITDPNPKKCGFRIIESVKDYGKRNYTVHIAIAPTKNISRFEWFLEKATEVGVDEITPLQCGRSERNTLKMERLERVLVSAMKQARRAFRPTLNNITSVEQFLERDFHGKGFIAHCEGEKKPFLNDRYVPGENALLMIGPEGDFTPAEIEAAKGKKMQEISLGPDRLRTETAGLIACFTIHLLNQSGKK
jgi:16S rRNA (uracil1498-N3)-methyltransferase